MLGYTIHFTPGATWLHLLRVCPLTHKMRQLDGMLPQVPQVLKSVSGVNHFSEAPLLPPHKQPLLHLIKFLRQNDWCPPKCVRLPLFLGATLASSPPPAEKRLKLQADELWREHHEEQRNEFENFVEEQNDGKSSSASDFGEVELCGRTM